MSFISSFFGTEKAVDNITNKDSGLLVKVGGWVNDLSYTDAEKAENAAKTREWGLRQLEALAPFKVVQRIIAFLVMGVWALAAINVITAIWIKALYKIDASKDMLAFATSDYVFWPALAVISLYFSGGVVSSFKEKK